jgi:hypothetical protein
VAPANPVSKSANQTAALQKIGHLGVSQKKRGAPERCSLFYYCLTQCVKTREVAADHRFSNAWAARSSILKAKSSFAPKHQCGLNTKNRISVAINQPLFLTCFPP